MAEEIQGLLDGEIYDCADAEREEIDTQCQAACEEIDFEGKLNPQWIREEFDPDEIDDLDIDRPRVQGGNLGSNRRGKI